MASDLDKAAKEPGKFGLDLTQVLRDTHTETAMKLGVLLGNYFEIALKARMLRNNESMNEQMFQGSGELATLHKKVQKARSLKLIDKIVLNDADLVRKIRNNFGHEREKLHFDSAKTVALAKQLSTYESAETNQDAILAAVRKITEQLENTVKNGSV